jgi:histidinol dehydrogenase
VVDLAAEHNMQPVGQQLLDREMLVVAADLEVSMVLLIGGQAAVAVLDLSEAMAQVVVTVDLVEPVQSGFHPLQQQ